MNSWDSKNSRQRLVRVLIHIDDWLAKKVKRNKAKDPDRRCGIATEINKLLQKAYDEENPAKPSTKRV